jgi:SM-20-related protein
VTIPHVTIPHALSGDTIARLLAYANQQQSRMKHAEVHGAEGDELDPAGRQALTLDDLGPLRDELEAYAQQWLPDVRDTLGVPPFDVAEMDLTLVAYGDGAFYGRHIDTYTGAAAAGEVPRQLTFVCYFFREPKAFTGGALRLFDLFGRESIDIEPEAGLMTAFSSWTPHEVLPASCPSGAFEDFRFAVNIWVHGRRRT